MNSKKTATYGLLIALAFIFSYIESLIPIPFPIPGMKLGLANLVVIIALYGMGGKEALVLSVIRIILVGFTFRDPSTLALSFAGGLLSWSTMTLVKKLKLLNMVGVSIIGGVSHNIGQIIVAAIYISNQNLIFYLPVLIIFGVITGTLIGLLGSLVISRLKNVFHN